MLNLLEPTPPSWAQAAEGQLERLLTDHAHCELKAAQSALSLVARFAFEAPELVDPLTQLAREETEHFRAVHAKMVERGVEMERPDSDEYVRALREAARSDHQQAPVLLDRLLVSALIEARSCERFSVLAENLTNESLRSFYRQLMASEARHYRLFCGLAEERFGVERTRARLAVLAKREAEVAHKLPLGPTVHG